MNLGVARLAVASDIRLLGLLIFFSPSHYLLLNFSMSLLVGDKWVLWLWIGLQRYTACLFDSGIASRRASDMQLLK